jgi:hypothetical protein
MNPLQVMTDSDAFRRFERGAGRVIFRSRAYERLDGVRRNLLSRSAVRRNPGIFDDVRTFCFFIGHNKSGTSLLGGLLDAHPDVVLADEVDALKYVDAGFQRDQLFHLLLRGSRSEARKGRVTARRLEPYSYAVPGQWQGRTTRPLVIGDGRSGTSTRRLGTDPELLERLSRLMPGVAVRVIQVIRNPFDPISVMMVRGRRSFSNAIDHYFTSCEILDEIRRRVSPESLLPVRYESFIADPKDGLTSICRFLGVEAEAGYRDACASIVRPRPDRSREMVPWTQPWIEEVERRIPRFAFLEGYRYED